MHLLWAWRSSWSGKGQRIELPAYSMPCAFKTLAHDIRERICSLMVSVDWGAIMIAPPLLAEICYEEHSVEHPRYSARQCGHSGTCVGLHPPAHIVCVCPLGEMAGCVAITWWSRLTVTGTPVSRLGVESPFVLYAQEALGSVHQGRG